MRRITLNSYKRKIVVFGILVFMSIGLISTGFAAWVMSTNPEQSQGGNVSVGLIEDANLTIALDAAQEGGYNIAFEALASDTSGRIRAQADSLNESLKFTVSGVVGPAEFFGKLYYEFIIPEQFKKAVELGYIELPKGASYEKGTVQVEIPQEELEGTSEGYKFEIEIEFKWGSTFGGQNPGVYYDEDEEGLKVSDADAKMHVENLRAAIYGYYDELNAEGADRATIIAAHEADANVQFTLYITATTN